MANVFGALLIIEELQNEERHNARLLRRTLRDAHNPFQLSAVEFRNNFRLNQQAAMDLIDFLTPYMNHGYRIHTRVPNYLRILVSLNFFAVGSYQRSVGNNYVTNMSQPMVSRCLKEVSSLIIRYCMKRWIKYPRNNNQREDLKNGFMVFHELQHIIGIVDGTHIAIVKPSAANNEHVYVNRKGYHSLNVQIICDAKLRIISCLARYPGSSHDSHVWRNSLAGRLMRANYEGGDHETRILGDSGYPCLPWLLVPLGHPTTDPEIHFNNAVKRVRSSVERCIGVLKARFRCLLKDRTLHYTPNNAARIIITCAILHNIAIHYNVRNPEPVWDELDLEVPNDQDEPRADVLWRQRGQENRRQYIQRYF